MPPRFPSISLVPGGVTQTPSQPVKLTWGSIKGSLEDQIDLATALSSKANVAEILPQLDAINLAIADIGNSNDGNVNHKPVVLPASDTVSDLSMSVTGNLMSAASDSDGDPMSVSAVSYGGSSKPVGSSFASTYGSMRITSNGDYTFTLNSTARHLRTGQSASEAFGFTISDGQGSNISSTLTVQIVGHDSAPMASADIGVIPFGIASSGNILSNDTSPDGTSLSVVSYSIDGIEETLSAGDARTIPSKGTIVINASGAWTFTPISEFSGVVPAINYVVTNGYLTSTGLLQITVSTPAATVSPNPVTTAMSGDRTFHIGPGKDYLDLDTFPWTTLVAGDVVNIYHRSTPYTHKVGLFGIGTALRRIYINGVTDSSGNRPVINGDGARTAAGCMTPSDDRNFSPGNETYGIITLKPRSWGGERPCYFTIQNLELRGARPGATCYDVNGTARTWGFSSGIWLQPSTDIVIRNNVLDDNGIGLFTNSQEGGDLFGCERISVLYNRMSGNGEVGDDHQHNVYLQAYDVLVEGNYLGPLRTGSSGSAYKSRSGKEVIRGNWIEGRNNVLDIVQADGYYDGMVIKTDYGTSWVYSNVLLSFDSYRIIHFGGDNQGEQGYDWPVQECPANYRMKLFFWNNTVFSKATTGGQQYLFKLSFVEQVCEAWNNIFYQPGSRQLHWMHYSGTLNLRGTNLIYSPTGLTDWAVETSGMGVINRIGTVLNLDPSFANATAYDLQLTSGSPARNLSSGVPDGVPSDLYGQFPIGLEPSYRSNGSFLRESSGLTDLGAFEFVPGAAVRSAPAAITYPAIGATSFNPGSELSTTNGTWLYSPSSFSYQWQYRATADDAWADVGTDSNTFTAADVGLYRVLVSATNTVGTAIAASVDQEITSAPTSTIVQFKIGVRPTPPSVIVEITPDTPPVAGNTLVLFTSAVDSVSDNYGNTWVQVIDVPTVSYDSADNVGDQTWKTTVTSTGAGFVVTGTGTNNARQTGLLYETDGVVDVTMSMVGAWDIATGHMDITQPGQLVLAGHRSANNYSVTVYAQLESPPFYFDGEMPDGGATQHGAWHAHAPSAGTGALTVNQLPLAYGGYFTTMLVSILPPA